MWLEGQIRFSSGCVNILDKIVTMTLNICKENKFYHYVTLVSRNKTIEANLSAKSKELKCFVEKVDDLTTRLDNSEESQKRSSLSHESFEKQMMKYEYTLQQKDSEIGTLKLKLNSHSAITKHKESLSEDVANLEARLKAKRKEEKICEQKKHDELDCAIKDIRESLKKKALQSDLDRLSSRIPSNNNTPVPSKQHTEVNRYQNVTHHPNTEDVEDRQRRPSPTREERDNGRDHHTKRYNNEEIVLIMDSNMNFIEEKKFSFNMNTFKLKCGKAEILENKLGSYDLSKASHIVIGTGTNDIQDGADAESIFRNLKKAAERLVSSSEANVHLAQLPPMKGEKNKVVCELNSLIKGHSPKDVNVIIQEDLTVADLYDTKHVSIKSLRKFVKNIKDGIRAVRRKRDDNQQQSGYKRSSLNQHAVSDETGQDYRQLSNDIRSSPKQKHAGSDETAHEERQLPKNDRTNSKANNSSPTQQNVFDLLMKALQKSHENVIDELKDSLKMFC